jgi:hypothetical protein
VSVGLYSGVSGLALGIGLYRNVSGLWGGASGLINGFGGSGPFPGASLYLDFLTPPLDSRITFSRGTNATLVDSTGRVTYAPNNLLTFTEQFGNVIWTQTNITRVDGITDPNGGNSASRITATASNVTFQQIGPVVTANAISSFWVRRVSGTGAINLIGPNGGFSLALSVTSEWQRFSALELNRAGVVFAGVRITTIGDAVDIAFPQAEIVTYQTTPGPYVATTASAYYGPRFDYDPVTLAPRGLLIEEARTNVLTYSEQFNGPAWVSFAASVSVDVTAAPSGVTVADKITEAAGAANQSVYNGNTAPFSTVTASIYFKSSERTFAHLSVSGGGSAQWFAATFNLTTGVVTQQLAGASGTISGATITNAGNGWYRCTVTGITGASAASTFVYCGPSTTATPTPGSFGVLAYSGTAGSGIFAYGAQLEAGAFATSYIPTVASTVTRNAENAVMTGTNFSSWYNQSEGVFIANGTALVESSTTGYWNVNATAGVNANSMYSAFADARQLRVFDGVGAEQVSIASSGVTALVYAKTAAAYKLNDFAVSTNGGAVATDTSGTLPAPTQMFIGSSNGAYNGWIAQIAYYNTRLPNTQLQTLTAPSLATTLSLDFTTGSYNVGF